MGCAVTARGFSRCSQRKSCTTSCRGPLVALSPALGMQRGQEEAERGTERGRHPAAPRGAGAAHVQPAMLLDPETLCQGKCPRNAAVPMQRGGVQGHPPTGCHSTSGFDQRPAVTARLLPSWWSLLKNACGTIRLLGEALPGFARPQSCWPQLPSCLWLARSGRWAAARHWWQGAGDGDVSRKTQRRVVGQTDTSSTSISSQSPPRAPRRGIHHTRRRPTGAELLPSQPPGYTKTPPRLYF